jgi:hypothetical protein
MTVSPVFLRFNPPQRIVRCIRCGQHASVIVAGVILCGDCFLQQAERKQRPLLRALGAALSILLVFGALVPLDAP